MQDNDILPPCAGVLRETHTYVTRSFWGTVYAISRGVPLLNVYPREQRTGKTLFHLDNADALARKAINRWFSGEHPIVDAWEFIDAYYTLLNAIRQASEAQAPVEVEGVGA